jgi:predicted nucleic acid binding AN1-type Zn finger protein
MCEKCVEPQPAISVCKDCAKPLCNFHTEAHKRSKKLSNTFLKEWR